MNTGGKYDPGTNTWTATGTTNAPSVRESHTAVSTGDEMIVWGGYGGAYLDTGGRYNPGMDSWMAMSRTNAPDARYSPTTVWTGTQMIVWGGTDDARDFNTGGRYCAPPAQLGNISTRAFVQTGDNVMIGGFIVQGTGPKRVIIRAIGPELGAPPYNIPNALANPRLELHNAAGTLIGSNDDWQHTIIGGVITQNQVTDIQNSGHAPTRPIRVGDYCGAATGQLHRDRARCKQHDRSCSRRSVRSAIILPFESQQNGVAFVIPPIATPR